MSSSACDNCPAPTAGGNRRDFLVQPECCLETTHLAAAARKGRQSHYRPRRRCGTVPREASPVMGVRGQATGVLALPGASPRGSLVLSILGKNIAERVPPPRRRVPLPTAAKEPKRRFFRPRRLELPSGGQNLSGLRPSFRATGPWRGKCLGLPLPPGPPGSCHVVWPTINGGPMRHRPLPHEAWKHCVGAAFRRPRQLPSSYGW